MTILDILADPLIVKNMTDVELEAMLAQYFPDTRPGSSAGIEQSLQQQMLDLQKQAQEALELLKQTQK